MKRRRHEQMTKNVETWYEPGAGRKQWTASAANGNNIG